MTRILEVDAQELIGKAAEELKKENSIKPPVWSTFVKTSHARERLPERNDWWYVRSASVSFPSLAAKFLLKLKMGEVVV